MDTDDRIIQEIDNLICHHGISSMDELRVKMRKNGPVMRIFREIITLWRSRGVRWKAYAMDEMMRSRSWFWMEINAEMEEIERKLSLC